MTARRDVTGAVARLQIDDVLPKPFDLTHLYALVARWAGADHDGA